MTQATVRSIGGTPQLPRWKSATASSRPCGSTWSAPAQPTPADERLPGWIRPSNWSLTGFLVPSSAPPERRSDADEDDDFQLVSESAGLAEESGEARRAAKRGFFASSAGGRTPTEAVAGSVTAKIVPAPSTGITAAVASMPHKRHHIARARIAPRRNDDVGAAAPVLVGKRTGLDQACAERPRDGIAGHHLAHVGLGPLVGRRPAGLPGGGLRQPGGKGQGGNNEKQRCEHEAPPGVLHSHTAGTGPPRSLADPPRGDDWLTRRPGLPPMAPGLFVRRLASTRSARDLATDLSVQPLPSNGPSPHGAPLFTAPPSAVRGAKGRAAATSTLGAAPSASSTAGSAGPGSGRLRIRPVPITPPSSASRGHRE